MKKANKSNFHLYRRYLRKYAHANRHNMTRAEACLWKYGLSKSKLGHCFKRQRPIDKFIVDFVCLKLKLVIEVDGWTHTLDTVIRKDGMKDRVLTEAGFTVLRFTDEAVLTRMPDVIEEIVRVIAELEAGASPSLRSALPKSRDRLSKGGEVDA